MNSDITPTWAGEIRASIDGDFRTDAGTRAAFASDASNHRVLPQGVAFPRHAGDVAFIVQVCREEDIPVTARGTGTNIAGNAIGPGVVVDFTRHMNNILSVDPEARTAVVEPGVILDALRARAEHDGLTFGVDPSTHDRCTLGGMIGTNACGSHSVAWGTTADNVHALDLVLADGTSASVAAHGRTGQPIPDSAAGLVKELITVRDAYLGEIRTELGTFRRQISGYGLQYLLPENNLDVAKALVGSEGSCSLITAATVKLVRSPPVRQLVVAGYRDEYAAAVAAPVVAQAGPLTVEGMEAELVRASDSRPGPGHRPTLPEGSAWLLVEVGGFNDDDARAKAEEMRKVARETGAIDVQIIVGAAQRGYWSIRERGAGLASRTADGQEAWPGWEDAAVPPENLGAYIRDFRSLMARFNVHGMLYGHFGEGCLHIRIDHNLFTAEGVRHFRHFQEAAAEVVTSHGGSLSGEHGDGRARSELLDRQYSPRMLAAFGAFKHAFDPGKLLNPGIIVDPAPLDADLRNLGQQSATKGLAFAYSDDSGDFTKAVRRCVGVGSCRTTSGGGMCPSFRATQDERHSTRGRSRLLSEMMNGSLQEEGWRSTEVKDALDLCLSCKACHSECPVSVDMATYKAEFLYQHYKGRIRQASHYSMGWLPLWLRLASPIAPLVNLAMGIPGVAKLARTLGGIDQQRAIPKLYRRTGRSALRRTPAPDTATPEMATPDMAGAQPVIVWLDSFTDSFSPGITGQAVALLRAAGYQTLPPPRGLCCGLTWVSTGQLDAAKTIMRRTVAALDDGSETPIIVLEPSCGAALRTDVVELLNTDAAKRVSARVKSLAEALSGRGLDFDHSMPTKALAQFHCHQRSTFGTEADTELLISAGLDVTSVTDGCCGLAGNFGFEKGHYDVSVACAEQSFMPALQQAGPEDEVVADGFSCRLQIEQIGKSPSKHLAQLLHERLIPNTERNCEPDSGDTAALSER
ncbi:FAD-binding and (Fe-S)-binding domain-containing protein [Arthrobacter sp. A5]|uniref:FAD-binding and (Fe-S)-binding domain-containing protein n=1 Tax=Arthrobacter sp. A5 TaxID=576926 RepID=UPI003DA7F002